ncbi:hypothetical protein [Alkaliphilus serpentinus]|uniref:Uncharacterized protein n=1 Tax=Alkaliphilus serpentinus TaxID=1482731 RepID=A0A833HNU9_9FIRM|nr:hypothetical protein [Alkaliphilus serpentinus]KAB3530006.1 hypothetical protein F8153_07870 [Alkaliphilus serpentinus]
MKRNVKKMLSLVIALLLVIPSIGLSFASSEVTIQNVYFQDDNGNMVFVNYAEAIEQSMNGDNTLYRGIQELVGEAESDGSPIYLETNTGVMLDYRRAITNNLFRLQDILGNNDYVVSEDIEYTHELRVVDGNASIEEIEEDSQYVMTIHGPSQLDLNEAGVYTVRTTGDGAGNVDYTAIYEYSVTGGEGLLEYHDGTEWVGVPLTGTFGPSEGFTLTPDWDATTNIRFTPSVAGVYEIEISLIDLEEDEVLAEVDYQVTTVAEPAIVSIAPVDSVVVEEGTTEAEVIDLLALTTTITDSEGQVHTVSLQWSIEDYNANEAGDYTAIGTFELPAGVMNPSNIELQVVATVTVVEIVDWPQEVEDVFVGTSAITGNTYANINIKAEYVDFVEEVYVDGELATQMEQEPSQWRIVVPEGTTADDLRGRIVVVAEYPEPELNVTFRAGSPYLPILHLTVESVENLDEAVQYDVTYMLAGGLTETTAKANIGEETEGFFYNGVISSTVTVTLYNGAGEAIHSEVIVPVL